MNIKDTTGKLYYIGGCVRDEILGIEPLDYDICYEGDAISYVSSCGFEILKTQNEIRTAKILIEGREVDFASTRKEIYPKAGHLPVTVEIGCSLYDDLKRRDFTINSIAKSVMTGDIIDPTGGLSDIKSGLLRIHHKNSFKDDPTRIVRGLKFALRYGFELEIETAKLQNEYLNNVNYDMSYSRLKKELIDTFNLNKDEALSKFIEQGIYKLLSPNLPNLPNCLIEDLINEFEIKNPWICYLGWLNLSRLELTKEEKKVLEDYERLKRLSNNADNFIIYKNCAKSDIRAIILWIMSGAKEAGLKYLRHLRYVKPIITGEDIVSMGITGVRVGEILDKILAQKLNNPNMTKEDELKFIK